MPSGRKIKLFAQYLLRPGSPELENLLKVIVDDGYSINTYIASYRKASLESVLKNKEYLSSNAS